jgi:hypothetical protein
MGPRGLKGGAFARLPSKPFDRCGVGLSVDDSSTGQSSERGDGLESSPAPLVGALLRNVLAFGRRESLSLRKMTLRRDGVQKRGSA